MKTNFTRKEFLRLALTAAGGALISACTPQPEPTPAAAQPLIITSTPKPEPSATMQPPAATSTSLPLSTATRLPATPTQPAASVRRPEVIRFYPQVPSRVVHTSLPGVWQGDQLVPDALGRMLDHSITRLTGLNDAGEAWKALFAPEERVAIKVNTILNSIFWTHVPLVNAVTQRLVEAGLKPENILIYDRDATELTGAGFTINKDGPGVRTQGTMGLFTRQETIAGYPVRLNEMIYDVDALINMPILKTHSLSGFTFGMKNHYGTFDSPGGFHGPKSIVEAISDLNALPVIKDRTRLVIGDALTACLREADSWPYWPSAETGDSIFMSFDPVAHDAAGLEHFAGLLEADSGNTQFARKRSGEWLTRAAELGVGTNDLSQIELLEEKLS